jgi:hypothetical protein
LIETFSTAAAPVLYPNPTWPLPPPPVEVRPKMFKNVNSPLPMVTSISFR